MKPASLLTLIAAFVIQTATAQIKVLAVTDAATFTPGMPYYGSLASVFCTGLTGINGIQSTDTLPLPYELAGISVTVSGAAAPLLAVADFGSYQQINIQVPGLQVTPQILQVSQSGKPGRCNGHPPRPGVFSLQTNRVTPSPNMPTTRW